MSLALTSCITPRPNEAAGPVTRRSVSTVTRVPASSAGSIVEVIVAVAVPWPRLSRALALITARRADSSASSMRIVPWKLEVIGPSLTFIVPRYSSPSPASIEAPGRHGAMRATSSSTAHTSSSEAGTTSSLVSLMTPPRGSTETPALVHHRLVESALTGLQVGDRLPHHQALEVL